VLPKRQKNAESIRDKCRHLLVFPRNIERFKVLGYIHYIRDLMKNVQEQQMVNREVSIKLDKIANMLNDILEKMEKEEPKLDKKLVKKIVKEWKDIDAGRVKLHRYESLDAFEKSLG
jgi:hypothetical protein